MPVSWEVRLSFLADCVRTRHRRAYPYMDFVRDEIAGVEASTELIIHRNVATSGNGLLECLSANLFGNSQLLILSFLVMPVPKKP